MVREHLSERLKTAGRELLDTTDALDMHAQGAMWVFDHSLQDWRFYLVTSLVDTLGRRKTYRLLLDAFDRVALPEEMTVEDVHLGSPQDPLFRLISGAIGLDGHQATVENCTFNGVLFDGIIYRSVGDAPTILQAERIEKRFAKRVKELPARSREAWVHA